LIPSTEKERKERKRRKGGRKGKKEGRKEGRREGRKEGKVFSMYLLAICISFEKCLLPICLIRLHAFFSFAFELFVFLHILDIDTLSCIVCEYFTTL
jgi:hypothetical protein